MQAKAETHVLLCVSSGWQVGGGMGRSHRNAETEPLLAQPLGYVDKEDVLYAVKAIVATQRDYGRRDDRKQARMKYLIRDWGIDKFRTVVEQYFGKSFQAFKELPEWEFFPYVGWGEQVSSLLHHVPVLARASPHGVCCAPPGGESLPLSLPSVKHSVAEGPSWRLPVYPSSQGDGRLYYGLHIENGRIKGEAKKALREVIEGYNLPVRISANQNLILCDIRKSWKPRITQALAAAGLVVRSRPTHCTVLHCTVRCLLGLDLKTQQPMDLATEQPSGLVCSQYSAVQPPWDVWSRGCSHACRTVHCPPATCGVKG